MGTSARRPRRAALPADSAVRHLRECQSIYLKLAWQQLAVEGQGRKEKGEGARVHVRCRLSNAGLTVALEGTLALPSRIPADPKTYPSSLTLADRTAGGVRVSVRAAPRMHVVRCWHVVASPAVPPELYAELARVARRQRRGYFELQCYGARVATSAPGLGSSLLHGTGLATCHICTAGCNAAANALRGGCCNVEGRCYIDDYMHAVWCLVGAVMLSSDDARWVLNLAVRRAERPLLRLVSRSQSTMFAPCLVAAHAARAMCNENLFHVVRSMPPAACCRLACGTSRVACGTSR